MDTGCAAEREDSCFCPFNQCGAQRLSSASQVADSQDTDAVLAKQKAAKAKGLAETDMVAARSFEQGRCVREYGHFVRVKYGVNPNCVESRGYTHPETCKEVLSLSPLSQYSLN